MILNIKVILNSSIFLIMFKYGKDKLTLKKVFELAQGRERVELILETKEKIEHSNGIVQKVIRSKKTIYGINTGFGPFCDTLI